MKRIAIIGSAPSSVRLAPYQDPNWLIWCCSPGAMPHAQRVDRYFELHAWKDANPCKDPAYVQKLAALKAPVYMVHPAPEIPTAVPFPKEEVLGYCYGLVRNHKGEHRKGHFNPSCFRSTISWMMAMAIMEEPEVIGFWGVDMAANNEHYEGQKYGLHDLINIAKSIGIAIHQPIESDLLRPYPPYGYQEHDHLWVKTTEFDKELSERQTREHNVKFEAAMQEKYYTGARDVINYIQKTWVTDAQSINIMFGMPERVEPPVGLQVVSVEESVPEGVDLKLETGTVPEGWREPVEGGEKGFTPHSAYTAFPDAHHQDPAPKPKRKYRPRVTNGGKKKLKVAA